MRLYITGGTGFVGSNIVKVALERYDAEVLSTVHRWRGDTDLAFTTQPVDITDQQQAAQSIDDFGPDVVIHNAILNDFQRMYADRKLGWRTYVEATRHMVDSANRAGREADSRVN